MAQRHLVWFAALKIAQKPQKVQTGKIFTIDKLFCAYRQLFVLGNRMVKLRLAFASKGMPHGAALFSAFQPVSKAKRFLSAIPT
ncbi:MAG: hypothetical protein R3A44_41695 [Caldilineaceae bacterium]